MDRITYESIGEKLWELKTDINEKYHDKEIEKRFMELEKMLNQFREQNNNVLKQIHSLVYQVIE